jgi:hypothetical protein
MASDRCNCNFKDKGADIKCYSCKLSTAQCKCDHKEKVTKTFEGEKIITHSEPTEVKKSFEETKVIKTDLPSKVEKEVMPPIIKEHHKDVVHEHHKDVIEETHKEVIHEKHKPVIHEIHQPVIHETHVHEIHQPVIHKKEVDVIHEKEKEILEHQTINKTDVKETGPITHEHFEKPLVAEVEQKSPRTVNEGKLTVVQKETGEIEEKEHKGLGTKIKEFFTGKKEEEEFREFEKKEGSTELKEGDRPIIH